MYLKYADKRGWHSQVISSYPSAENRYKNAVLNLSGNGVFDRFKSESGIHVARRIPDSETSNRVHSCTAIVFVIPTEDELDLKKWEQLDLSILKKLQDKAVDYRKKIRTYDYTSNQITNHISNKTFSLKRVLEGNLDW